MQAPLFRSQASDGNLFRRTFGLLLVIVTFVLFEKLFSVIVIGVSRSLPTLTLLTVRNGRIGLMTKASEADCAVCGFGDVESRTPNTTVDVPIWVGVPTSLPVGSRASPGGSVPETMDH